MGKAVEEWWCNPAFPQYGDISFDTIMNDMNILLEEWRQRWSRYIIDDKWGETLDFHYCFTRFCLSTYFIRIVRSSSNNLSARHKAAVNKCVQFASDVLLVIIGLGSVARKKLEDMCHAIFIMISYCCLFILQAHSILGTLDESDVLELVRSVATLMIDIASHSNNTSLTYGKAILQRAELCKDTVSRRSGDAERLVTSNAMGINEWDSDLEGVRWVDNAELEFNDGEDSVFNSLFDFSVTFSEFFQDLTA
ncbi:hypothetical protein F5884DRAFT_751228 [Xylogone sp. PMI_703]|nr:hypothetical protein F5884DRAFT_751228 [Xylogone sp. PMI_703]